jgi:hypothetical protein
LQKQLLGYCPFKEEIKQDWSRESKEQENMFLWQMREGGGNGWDGF